MAVRPLPYYGAKIMYSPELKAHSSFSAVKTFTELALVSFPEQVKDMFSQRRVILEMVNNTSNSPYFHGFMESIAFPYLTNETANGGGTLGLTTDGYNFGSTAVAISTSLNGTEFQTVALHELGHVVDYNWMPFIGYPNGLNVPTGGLLPGDYYTYETFGDYTIWYLWDVNNVLIASGVVGFLSAPIPGRPEPGIKGGPIHQEFEIWQLWEDIVTDASNANHYLQGGNEWFAEAWNILVVTNTPALYNHPRIFVVNHRYYGSGAGSIGLSAGTSRRAALVAQLKTYGLIPNDWT